MKRIESYIERGLTVEEIAKEFDEFCGKSCDCSNCKYLDGFCRYQFLLDEMPHDKTLKELFYEKHPYAPATASNELPVICPHQLGWGSVEDCYDDPKGCAKCWNRLCKDVLGDEEE